MTVDKLRSFLYATVAITSTALVWIASSVAVKGAGATTPIVGALTCDMTDDKSSAGVAAAVDPLVIKPGREIIGPPRSESDIKRASASFHTTSCGVKTDGVAVEVTFPGLSMGIFSGDLRFTAYRGTNLLRMDALATTREEWIAYKYEAGLKGFSTDLTPRVVWRDTGGQPQQYAFGGVVHKTLAPEKAQNRLLVAEGKSASLAAFPAPHTFFFTREVDTNLGYVWYRKDSPTTFAFGIRQADAE